MRKLGLSDHYCFGYNVDISYVKQIVSLYLLKSDRLLLIVESHLASGIQWLKWMECILVEGLGGVFITCILI